MKTKLFYASVLFLLISFGTQAQNRLLRYADDQMARGNVLHAGESYAKAYNRRAKVETARKAAEAYEMVGEYDKAFDWWSKTLESEDATSDDLQSYLRAAMKAGSDNFDSLLDLVGQNEYAMPDFDFALINEAKSRRANIQLVPFEEVNSVASDFGAAFDQMENFYFSSDRGGEYTTDKKAIRLDAKNRLYSLEKSNLTERDYYRLYRFSKDGEIIPLELEMDDALQVSNISLDRESNTVFFTVLRDVNKIKGLRTYSINQEIYFGKLNNGIISDIQAFPLNDLTNYGVQHPFIDSDNKRIFFASNMPGGFGGYDLYYVTYDEEWNFGDPVNLGERVNSKGNEAFPSLDKGILYFASNGFPGLGGFDIYRSTPQADQTFGNAENLGAPINSAWDDFAYFESSKGRFLSSDRQGGMGLDDIYLIENLYKFLLAEVVDCDGNIFRSEYEVKLLDRASDESIGTERNDVGQLLAELPLESDFWLKISKKGHFSIYDSLLSTKGLETDTLYREYLLAPIPYNLPVAVDIVYYDLDKSQIRKDAAPVLDKIAELMQRHDFLDLSVASHTDSRASNAYNEALSQRRADAVRDYLSNFGISPDRVKINWFGEENLVNDCGDGVPCSENSHQLNRRSELVLEAFTDPEREYELPADLIKDICDLGNLPQKLQEELKALPTIYFDFDKSMLRAVHQADLDRVALMLKKMPKLQLYLAGHTDQRGGSDYNMGLAERRAKAVLDYLVKRGVEKGRVGYEWFGKSQPIYDCDVVPCDEAMHQLNRRTEVRWDSDKE